MGSAASLSMGASEEELAAAAAAEEEDEELAAAAADEEDEDVRIGCIVYLICMNARIILFLMREVYCELY